MDREERLRAHGLSKNFSLTVEIKPEIKIFQTSDNADIVSNLKELRKVLKDNHFPQVQKWLKVSFRSLPTVVTDTD